MASSLETNKLFAAVLTAGVIASGAGVMSRILYHAEEPEETAYQIAVADEGEGGGEGGDGGQPLGVLLASADASAGEAGSRACAACHSFEEGGANKIGPALHGVVGREIASAEGFAYSDALAGKEGAWDYAALDGFLTNPKEWAPGTKMSYAGIKSGEDRADMILYLRSISPDAPPLPEPEAATAEGGGESSGGDQQQASADQQQSGGEQASADQQQSEEQGAEQQQAAATEEPPADASSEQGGGAAAEGAVAMIASADPAAGESAARKCVACHSFDEGGPNKIGPNLHGVVGREVASVEGFNYSGALKDKGGSWDYASLDAFLEDPRGWAKGTRMAFAGVKKEEERADILAYLRSVSPDAPPPPGQ